MDPAPVEVDFYLLEASGEEQRQRFVCRVAEKAWREGFAVRIATGDPERARALDRLLWTFRDDSFVPHRIEAGDVVTEPSRPGHGERALWINATDDALPAAPAPARIAEVVAGDAGARDTGRSRYRAYRERGWTLRTHEL